MKILNVILSLRGGGAERQLAYLAPVLAARDHEVHVAYVYPGVYLEHLAAASRCPTHQIPAASKHDPRVLLRIVQLMRRVRPHVIHTWLPHMDILGGSGAKLLGIPWVMSERNSALMYPPAPLNRVRIATGRHADVIVANSPGGAEYWEALGVPCSRLEVVPNFAPRREEIESAPPLRHISISADDELVVHVGRLSPEKNLPTVVAAMGEVCRRRARTKFALCGDGPLLKTLVAQVRDAHLGDRVVFAGFVPNVASWLKRAHVVVAASRCEGHPNAVLEAILAGVPLVLSDIPAYRNVADEASACFAPVNDSSAIAAAIEQTLEHRGPALERAARARRAAVCVSAETTASRYEDVYDRAAADRTGRVHR